MTTPRPSLSGDGGKSWLQYDLRDLPPLRRYREKFPPILAANAEARAEGKAYLYAELEQAAKARVPLDVALRAASKPYWKPHIEGSVPQRRGPLRATVWRHRIYLVAAAVLIALFVFSPALAIPAPLFFYLMVFVGWEPHGVARRMAARLLTHVEKGHSLSHAMESCSSDFAINEVRIVRLGESTERLPEALAALSRPARSGIDGLGIGNRVLAYPCFFLVVCLFVFPFLMMKIYPRFDDIFLQLGATPATFFGMPGLSTVAMSSGTTVLICLLLSFMVVRTMLVGTRGSRILFRVLVLSAAWLGFLQVIRLVLSVMNVQTLQASLAEIAFPALLGFIAALITLPLWLRVSEQTMVLADAFLRSFLRLIQPVSSPIRLREEAEWLAGLSMGLAAGATLPISLRVAADSCEGELRLRGMGAADAAERGSTISEALAHSRTLTPSTRLRVALIESVSEPASYVNDLASEKGQESQIAYAKLSQAAAVLLHLALAIFVGLMILSIYAALLGIPLSILRLTI